jgi:hypothetical protein
VARRPFTPGHQLARKERVVEYPVYYCIFDARSDHCLSFLNCKNIIANLIRVIQRESGNAVFCRDIERCGLV